MENTPQRILSVYFRITVNKLYGFARRESYSMLKAVTLKPRHKLTVTPGPGCAANHLGFEAADL